MNERRDRRLVVLLLTIGMVGALAGLRPARASTTGFSYQGQLKRDGQAVDEPAGCSFRFGAYASPGGAQLLGQESVHSLVEVTNGLFTVPEVDFGAGVFDGDPRWMSIEVQCPADGGWQLLQPRQPITGSPYAVHGHAPWRTTATDVFYTDGNVGMGTAAPVEALDVQGDVRIVSDSAVGAAVGSGALIVQNSAGTLGVHIDSNDIRTVGPGSLNLNVDNVNNTRINGFVNVKVDGKVGVGTSSPVEALDVVGDVRILSDSTVDSNVGSGALMVQNSAGTLGIHIDSNDIRTIGSGSLQLNHDNVNNTRINNFLHVKLDNKVGIGTALPASALHVAGEVTTDVLTILAGSDLAERFDVDGLGGRVEPGHVVSIDPENPGKLVLTTIDYDRNVAGVVSGAGSLGSGLVMGQTGSLADGDHPVALTGRVYVWVDADHGAVRPGDFLTTSTTPGHAMKAADHDLARGAILGKAMTSLSGGQGLVLTLVSLQ